MGRCTGVYQRHKQDRRLHARYAGAGRDRQDGQQIVPVDVELEEKLPPDTLWHGTGEKYVSSIDREGLIPKSRLYVHLSADIDTARTVGKRHGKPAVYEVDCRKMAEDDYRFFLSSNGVWLTGKVPAGYLKRPEK